MSGSYQPERLQSLSPHAPQAETGAAGPSARGAYLLADDAVLHWAIGMLRSLRRHEPHLPVIALPFGGPDRRVRQQLGAYGIGEWDDLAALSRWEALGAQLYPSNPVGARLFRKIAVFSGVFEHFAFIDCDVMLRQPLGWGFDALAASSSGALFYDEGLEDVYADADLRSRMQQEFGSRGWNTGLWFGKRGAVTFEEGEAVLPQALCERAGFASTGEQPFFNFLLDVLAKDCSSLRGDTSAFLAPSLIAARLKREDLPRAPALHWAGYADPALSMPYAGLWFRERLTARRPRHLLSLFSHSLARPLVRRMRTSVRRR